MQNDSGAARSPNRVIDLANTTYRAVWAIFFVVGTVVLALIVAKRFDLFVEQQIADSTSGVGGFFGSNARYMAVTGLSIGLLITSLKSLWGALTPLYAYVRRDKEYDFATHLMAIFAPAFLLSFTYQNFQRGEPLDTDSQTAPAWSVHYIAPIRPSSERNAIFPLFFEPGKLKDLRVISGFEIDEVHSSAITSMIKAFAPCASSVERVALEVVGFASSTPFEGLDDTEDRQLTRRLNKDLANLRAASVSSEIQKTLREIDADSKFAINLISHATHDAMERSRIFDDRPPGAGDRNESEFFTRSVHIRVQNAGRCEYGQSTI